VRRLELIERQFSNPRFAAPQDCFRFATYVDSDHLDCRRLRMRGVVPKFDVQVDQDLDARIIRVQEPIVFDDLVRFYENAMDVQVVLNNVWEFAPGTLQFLNLEELKRFLGIRRTNIERRDGGHTVIVAYEPSEKMLVKWYKTFAEGLPFHDVTFHLADSLEEAFGILRQHKSGNAGS